MMSIWRASLNGFLTTIHLDSLPMLVWSGRRLCRRSQRLLLTPNRCWLLESPAGREPVLLLRYKSFWWQHFAGITVQKADSGQQTLWFIRRGNSAAWRRLRVHFCYP